MKTLTENFESPPFTSRATQVKKGSKSRPLVLDRMNDWQYLERSIHRLIAAWGRHFSDWDDRSVIHRHVWDQAEIVQKLRSRIEQFPGGNSDAPVSAKLEHLANTLLLAPSFEDAVDGIYEIMARTMAGVYVEYTRSAHPVHDAPTICMLHDICMLKEQQWLWMRDYRRRRPHQVKAGYRRAVTEALNECGGLAAALPVEGEGARPAGVGVDLIPPRPSLREANYRYREDLMSYIRVDFPNSVEARRLFWALVYMLEKDIPDDQLRWIYWGHYMPWDFHYNISRHLWDESRHGDSGNSRLLDFGITREEVASVRDDDAVAKREAPLDPRSLYEEVFFIGMVAEQGHFIVKNQAYQDFRDGGDLESAEMMLFDIIDETQHVQYAHRWLPVLAQFAKIDNSDYKERAAARRKELQDEELAKSERDRLLPRLPGVRAWDDYQEFLSRIRVRYPLAATESVPVRAPKPM